MRGDAGAWSSGSHHPRLLPETASMKSKRADKVLLSAMPTPPADGQTPSKNGEGNGASPYRSPRESRPRIAPERAPRWQPKDNILQIAAATGRFETLGQAIAGAGLT